MSGGLLDEIQIHLAPVLLDSGTRLFDHLGGQFELRATQAITSLNATHLRFKVLR
ncbi:hypothetical protein ACTMTI_42580 [Nonomuraea sp. H19]|uniref:hypothetical protein n=1 Tax=Nonomuraea sp. H19 TaxID=3452206 RepID=UPI003F8C93FE